MCEYVSWPLYKWYSGSDDTDLFPGIQCTRIEGPAPETGLRAWLQWRKILDVLDHWPW